MFHIILKEVFTVEKIKYKVSLHIKDGEQWDTTLMPQHFFEIKRVLVPTSYRFVKVRDINGQYSLLPLSSAKFRTPWTREIQSKLNEMIGRLEVPTQYLSAQSSKPMKVFEYEEAWHCR